MSTDVQTFAVGGREFRLVQRSTVKHDVYMLRHLRAAGVTGARPGEGETQEQFCVRVHEQILDSGQMLPILAGMLVPVQLEDLQWTPAIASETEEFLDALFEPADKAAMHKALAQFSGFFAAGLLSREPSAGASQPPQQQEASTPQQPADAESATAG